MATRAYQVDGETVVEAIFGHSGNINAGGYAAGRRPHRACCAGTRASPTRSSRPATGSPTSPTSEAVHRRFTLVAGHRPATRPLSGGIPNPVNNGEWDNLPAQRCFWYQVQKVMPAVDRPVHLAGGPFRSMVVYVDQSLQARTLLERRRARRRCINAALIAPNVVNVIPQTIFTR